MPVSSHGVNQSITYHYDLYLPDVLADDARVLICLHGYGQSKDTALYFGQNIRPDWPIIAMQAPHPHFQRKKHQRVTGFSWVSDFKPEQDIQNHHAFIRHVIQHAQDETLTKRPPILFGFSQSVSLNYQFVARHPQLLGGVIAVAGATPGIWQNNPPRISTPVLHIAAQQDPAYPNEKQHHYKTILTQACTNLTWQEFAGGHRVPKASYEVMRDWLASLT